MDVNDDSESDDLSAVSEESPTSVQIAMKEEGPLTSLEIHALKFAVVRHISQRINASEYFVHADLNMAGT
jgi:hypothetical protein